MCAYVHPPKACCTHVHVRVDVAMPLPWICPKTVRFFCCVDSAASSGLGLGLSVVGILNHCKSHMAACDQLPATLKQLKTSKQGSTITHVDSGREWHQ